MLLSLGKSQIVLMLNVIINKKVILKIFVQKKNTNFVEYSASRNCPQIFLSFCSSLNHFLSKKDILYNLLVVFRMEKMFDFIRSDKYSVKIT